MQQAPVDDPKGPNLLLQLEAEASGSMEQEHKALSSSKAHSSSQLQAGLQIEEVSMCCLSGRSPGTGFRMVTAGSHLVLTYGCYIIFSCQQEATASREPASEDAFGPSTSGSHSRVDQLHILLRHLQAQQAVSAQQLQMQQAALMGVLNVNPPVGLSLCQTGEAPALQVQ